MTPSRSLHFAGMIAWLATCYDWTQPEVFAEKIVVQLQSQEESSPGSGRFHQLVREEKWLPEQTAIIVCDMWDLHHCLNAVRRVKQIAPRIDDVLHSARGQGVTIIHAPSGCMDSYANHPARTRAMSAPVASDLPAEISSWCYQVPTEKSVEYPIDQADGGEDDDPIEHAQWAAHLEVIGHNPAAPWNTQIDIISIDSQHDFISDRGDEIWNILQSRAIQNVILTGVHTNMCVLGRPFGLRQLTRSGKHVVLMRDVTDTMYNPQRWPYVSHFTGTDLILDHIERHLCPTITSNQLIGGKPLRFQKDRRPHLVMVIAENEYQTNESLPRFAAQHLGRDFRVTRVFGSDQERNHIPGWEVLKDADILLVSIRRRVLPKIAMDAIVKHVKQGKPVVGIRTASHAFSLQGKPVPKGYTEWPEFDAQVFGGNYHDHLGNQLKSVIEVTERASTHPILIGFSHQPFVQGGSLYLTSPLAKSTNVLLTGKAEGYPPEPVAWTFIRSDSGRSFYTSLGHIDDFANHDFVRLLHRGIRWAAGLDIGDVLLPPQEPLWIARPLTRPGEFTAGIEGPACDSQGNIFAVNYERQGTIGRVLPNGRGTVFAQLPADSIGNGIRFAPDGMMYVADYQQHRVLRIDPSTREVSTLAHHEQMHQPNDLAMAADGTLYASDPDWSANTGQIWRIDADGTTTRLATKLGTTNGIEVSPGGHTLYVNESVQRNVWAFTITSDHTLVDMRLVRKFDDHGFDGMRCDIDGNLYITRHGKGTVIKMSPSGKILYEIDVLGAKPSNLCFGGPDGCTVYVTEVEHTRLVQFRVDRPGLAWTRWQKNAHKEQPHEP